MPKAKFKSNLGLGNALMNDRFAKGRGQDRRRGNGPSITRVNHTTGEQYTTNERGEASWVKMRSVTEQGALEEFLATAELAGTDFSAQKLDNIKIIRSGQWNPYLLSAAEERNVWGRQWEHRARLAVPRRPRWDEATTPEELDRMEREAFLAWRRNLAELQENHDLLMTPFERNLEVWRQLWRVIERSDVVIQIVDARNPLMFRSEDLEAYVKEFDSKKQNLLLINKADMLTPKQRASWAKYLKKAKVAFKFFSASLAKTSNEQVAGSDSEDEVEDAKTPAYRQDFVNDEDGDTRILTVDELENTFLAYVDNGSDHKLQVGLVGYPNVGKSSTINALIGAKKVSVSATPGKTKHFQTIHLSDQVILCDCPGLVFPNFATTKADLVCNGVLPIDQLREFTGPVALVAQRIPQSFLEAIYGIQIHTHPLEEGGTGVPTAEEVLSAYARHRGFMTQGKGQPDQSRAARYILKDYVAGKLLYCEPPPESDVSAKEDFNRELYDVSRLPAKRRQDVTAAKEAISLRGGYHDEGEDEGTDDDVLLSLADSDMPSVAGPNTKRLDKDFFKAQPGNSGHIKTRPFNFKYTEQDQAAAATKSRKQLSGRKLRTMIPLEQDINPADVQVGSSKKHFKGGARGKKSKKGAVAYDD